MKHVEFAIISFVILVFVLQEYSLEFGALTTGPSLVTFLLFTSVHSLILSKVADAEFYPYETVQIDFFNQLLYKIMLCFFFIVLAIIFLLDYFFPTEVLLENSSLIVAVKYMFSVNVKMVFTLYPLLFGLTYIRKCRLSLRTVLVGLKLIDIKKEDRTRLVSKYLKWFTIGLNSYNGYLYKQRPKHIGIVGINDCYRVVHCVGLFGNPKERTIIARQIRCVLDSVGGTFRQGDFRQLLIALKNIKDIEDKNDYPTPELSNMIRITSFSKRTKEWLGSQWFLGVVSLIPIIVTIIEKVFPLFFK